MSAGCAPNARSQCSCSNVVRPRQLACRAAQRLHMHIHRLGAESGPERNQLLGDVGSTLPLTVALACAVTLTILICRCESRVRWIRAHCICTRVVACIDVACAIPPSHFAL